MSEKDTNYFLDMQLLNRELISRNLLTHSENIINKIEPIIDDIYEYILMSKIIKCMVLKNIEIMNMDDFKNEIDNLKRYAEKNLIKEMIEELTYIKNIYINIYSDIIRMDLNIYSK
jgi:hypothetical protein